MAIACDLQMRCTPEGILDGLALNACVPVNSIRLSDFRELGVVGTFVGRNDSTVHMEILQLF